MRVVQGYFRDAWLADFYFTLKREFWKLFSVTRDLKVLRDKWRTWIYYEPIFVIFFSCKNRSLEKSILLAYFRDTGKRNFFICNLWSPLFFPVCEECQRPPLYDRQPYIFAHPIVVSHCFQLRALKLSELWGRLFVSFLLNYFTFRQEKTKNTSVVKFSLVSPRRYLFRLCDLYQKCVFQTLKISSTFYSGYKL